MAQSQKSEAGSRREGSRKGMAPNLLHQTSAFSSLSSRDAVDCSSHNLIAMFFEQIEEEEEAGLPDLGPDGVTAKAPSNEEDADEEEDASILQQVLFQARLVSATA